MAKYKKLLLTSGVLILSNFIISASTISNLSSNPGVCPPDTINDSIRVSQTCPGITSSIFILDDNLSHSFMVYGNDNVSDPSTNIGLESGDGDYNDLWARIDINPRHQVTLTFLGSLSSLSASNAVTINGSGPINIQFINIPVFLGTFAVGEEVLLGLHTSGKIYFAGDPSRNEGDISHWIIQDPSGDSGQVPEPSTLGMMGIGLVMIGGGFKKYGKRIF